MGSVKSRSILSTLLVWWGTTLTALIPLESATSATLRHTVQPGETLQEIAEMYGYSTQELATINHIDFTQPIVSGMQLLFPAYSSTNHYPSSEYYPSPSSHFSPEGTLHIAEETTNRKNSYRDNREKQPSIHGTPYAYYGNGDPVSEAIKSFASNYGMPVIISDQITSVVNGKIGPLPPVAFLDALAQLNNLLWYFDGNTLYVYSAEEISKAIVNLQYMTTEDLKRILVDMGLWDNRYGWKDRPDEGLIYISGPPRYIELVTDTASLIDAKTGEKQKSQLSFQVFPLKYAWAEDHTISYRDKQVKVPGVATLLRQIVLGGGAKGNVSIETDSPTIAQSLQPATPITGKQPEKLAKQNHTLNKKEQSSSNVQAENIIINADRRSNAIIVYDLSSKMAMYEGLIQTLDKPLSQIEINVSIIDVDTTSVDELGIDWKLSGNNGNSFFGFDPQSSLTGVPSSSTILKVTAGELLTQVRMLATKDKAKILSRPSVLTLDNMEAVLDNNQTFYVSVNGSSAGDNTAQLYPITSGSVLKVTPRIIEENTGRKIHLDVNIQDGTSQDSSLTGVSLPIVKNTTISTQAMIDERESLLVGGYFYEKHADKEYKVPFLGDMPIIGNLFRNDKKEHTKNMRLFLITPKIVSLM